MDRSVGANLSGGYLGITRTRKLKEFAQSDLSLLKNSASYSVDSWIVGSSDRICGVQANASVGDKLNDD